MTSSFVICIDNSDYAASLEVGKVYKRLKTKLSDSDFITVIDESGEDYLYPRELFVEIELPKKAKSIFATAH